MRDRRPQRRQPRPARAARSRPLRRRLRSPSSRRRSTPGPRARPAGALPPDESRGRVRRVAARRARTAPTALIAQPGRVDALLAGRSATRSEAVRGAGRRGAHLERRRARGVAPQSVLEGSPRRGSSARGPRATARRSLLSRRASEPRSTRLRERLEEPLLVTNRRQRPLPDGLRELERRAARRAGRAHDALHRLPLPRGGARGRGRRGRGDAARTSIGDLGGSSDRPASRSRRRTSRYAAYRRLAAAASTSCPHRRRRGAARRQGAGRDRRDPPGRGDLRRGLRRALAGGAVRRADGARARLADRATLPRARRRATSPSTPSSRPADHGARPHGDPRDVRDRRPGRS